MKKFIIWAIIIILIGGAIFYFTRSKDDSGRYVTARAAKADIIQTVSVTGEIVPINEANVSFEVSGTIKDVYAEVGDYIKAGDKIAVLDDSVIQSQLREAYLELERQEDILKQSRRQLWDDMSPDEKSAAKLVVEKARASVWTLQKQAKKNVLYAPIDGIIVKKYLKKGELAMPSSPVVMIMGEGGLEIKADIPESDIVKIRIGQKAKTTFDAFSSDEIFEAEVSFIEPAATIIQDVVYYNVTFNILTGDDRFKPGMSADMDIATAEKNDVLAVPGQTVKTEGENKYVEVLIIGEDKKIEARKMDVKTGLRGDDGMIEIISGIEEGDEVITFVNE
ncbi:MAG: efflux RND transporter periplasmic adaptor subunit [Candidatus Moranbacteria bacterium]|nr:efflux RND transporter periplasmic adaptor subunit [Candidatus Moranbacteria bacterium]